MKYEQKYKAVLKTATQWIKDGCTDKEKICLECVFPELRESEDERIRKALIWHLKADVDFVSNGVTKAECIAYLEKQKESLHDSEMCKENQDSFTKDKCIKCNEYGKGYKYGYDEGLTIGYNKGVRETLADLEAEWKHGYDFANKEMWKPSEEQIEALDKARRFIPYNCDILESLYEQLKKL